MNIAIISFRDQDVSEGVDLLLDTYQDVSPTIFLPVLKKDKRFSQSVIRVAIDRKVKVVCFFENALGFDHLLKQADETVLAENPLKEVLHRLSADDAIGIVWDDTVRAHGALHSVEDLALDTWDISDGLEALELEDIEFELDEDAVHTEMLATMGKFVDLMCTFVASTVMTSLSQAIIEQLRQSQDDLDKKDIDPFDNLD